MTGLFGHPLTQKSLTTAELRGRQLWLERWAVCVQLWAAGPNTAKLCELISVLPGQPRVSSEDSFLKLCAMLTA